MCDLDGGCQALNLHVLLRLDEGNRRFWVRGINGLRKCKQNSGAEILAFQLEVVQAGGSNVAIISAEDVLLCEFLCVFEVLRHQLKRVVGRYGL